jgi:hypothetical protein
MDPLSLLSVGGSLLGGLLGGGSSGGTTTQSKEPWAAAAPWLTQQIGTGQQLQDYYQRNPFNAQQQGAYGNLSAGTNYMNQLVPSLMQQLSNQPGFNRSNPQMRPAPLNFSAGNLGFGSAPQMGSMNMTANPFANGGIQAPTPQMQQPKPYVDPYQYDTLRG